MKLFIIFLINSTAIGAVFVISIANMMYGWGLTPASWPVIITCFCGTVAVTGINAFASAVLNKLM